MYSDIKYVSGSLPNKGTATVKMKYLSSFCLKTTDTGKARCGEARGFEIGFTTSHHITFSPLFQYNFGKIKSDQKTRKNIF